MNRSNFVSRFVAFVLLASASAAFAQVNGSGWALTVECYDSDTNLQSLSSVSVDKKGAITGTLFDRSGTHPISNPVVNEDTLTFTVMHESPGIGDVPVGYTVSLDSDKPKVSIERPDPTPDGKAAGKKRKTEAAASHATN